MVIEMDKLSNTPEQFVPRSGQARTDTARLLPLLLVFFPSVAFAHGPGLAFMIIGIPFAIGAYLIGAALLVWSSGQGNRWKRAGQLAVGFPVWLAVFILPWVYYENTVSDYEMAWSFGLPTALLVVAGVLANWSRQK